MIQGAPIPRDDEQRLQALLDLDVLDTEPEPAFERLVRLAAQLTRAPIACLNLVDRDRVWTKAAIGIASVPVARTHAFCAHAILGSGVMEVEDTAGDERFTRHPWVAGLPFVRSYAAAPLVVGRHHAVGTLCVLDTVPRPVLAGDERQALLDLAAATSETLAARRERKELAGARREIERLTTHDGLTGVLNRRGLTDRLSAALALARRSGATVTVTLLDLDGFRDVNERFGHALGDEALRVVAHRLREAVREHDLVARTGGDEFAVVLQATEEAAAVVVAARLLADLARVHLVAGLRLELRASAGVATFPRDAEDLTGLLWAADVALARARAAGGGAMAYVPEAG
jgi:diguanylate cyclase